MVETRSGKRPAEGPSMKESKKRRKRTDYDEIFTVLIGERKTRFDAHKSVLTQRSGYFRAACHPDKFNEGKGKVIHIPELDDAIFTIYLQWAYQGVIVLPGLDDGVEEALQAQDEEDTRYAEAEVAKRLAAEAERLAAGASDESEDEDEDDGSEDGDEDDGSEDGGDAGDEASTDREKAVEYETNKGEEREDNKRMELAHSLVERAMKDLTRLYAMADYLNDTACRNAIVDRIIGAHRAIGCIPGIPTISTIYNQTLRKCKLRQLVVDYYVALTSAEALPTRDTRTTIDNLEDYIKVEELPTEFWIDFALANGRALRLKPALPAAKNRCYYHEHDGDVPECSPLVSPITADHITRAQASGTFED